MRYEIGPIRPPNEAYSLLVRFTSNCPWGKCAFCRSYKQKRFEKRSVEEIKEDIDIIRQIKDDIIALSWEKGFGGSINVLYEKTHIKPWFIEQMKELVALEEAILSYKGKGLPDDLLIRAKKDGFADSYLAQLLSVTEKEIREKRASLGMIEAWEPVPVSGVENAAYYYSTYNAPDKVASSARRKIMVLGGGPNRIGQGIEFDYCCVHAAFALRDEGMTHL